MTSKPVLCSAIPLTDRSIPDWLHLLPAGEVRTTDGRGPYRLIDPSAMIATSIRSGKLPIDENHATDLAAPFGKPAPARGWIVELQSRSDGVWGKVEWNRHGRQLMADRAYRGVSPVIVHDKAGAISAILRASLTNTPNLTGLVALHSQAQVIDDPAPLDVADREVVEKLGLNAEAYAAEKRGPRIADGLTNIDADMIHRLRLDPAGYAAAKAASWR